MSKRNHNQKKNGGHRCDCHSGRIGLFDGVTLHIEHLDIHLDERMYSRNCYCSGSGADTEETVNVDMEKLAEKVAADTGVDKNTVMKVLAAETVHLQKLGVCKVSAEEKAAEQVAEQENHHE